MKQKVWRYIQDNKGHQDNQSDGGKAVSAEQFARALVGNNSVSNVIVFQGKITGLTRPDKNAKQEIKDISLLNEFIFEDDAIVTRKFCGIGSGNRITKFTIPNLTASYNCEIVRDDGSVVPVDDQTPNDFFLPKVKPLKSVQAPGSCSMTEKKSEDCFYTCPFTPCDGKFDDYMEFQEHVTSNQCFTENVSHGQSITRFCRLVYFTRFAINTSEPASSQNYLRTYLTDLECYVVPNFTENSNIEDISYPRGYARTETTKKNRFDEDQKEFLDKIYEEGSQTKQKAKPNAVMKMMRTNRNSEGNKIFSPSQWLSESQIRSYFGRKTAELKYNTNDPTQEQIEEASMEEEMFEIANTGVAIAEQLKRDPDQDDMHPIEVYYNIFRSSFEKYTLRG